MLTSSERRETNRGSFAAPPSGVSGFGSFPAAALVSTVGLAGTTGDTT
jgi:hypothetical protein